MSLYNQIFGFNPLIGNYLHAISLHPDVIGRLRDAYLFLEDGIPCLHIFARVGGGNREGYQDNILQMQSHPFYIRDFDDDFDSTYATFVFKLPKKFKVNPEEIYTEDQKPMKRFRQMLEDLQTGKQTESRTRALIFGEKLVGKILDGPGGIIEV